MDGPLRLPAANTNPLGLAANVDCLAGPVVVLVAIELAVAAPRSTPPGPACVMGTLPAGFCMYDDILAYPPAPCEGLADLAEAVDEEGREEALEVEAVESAAAAMTAARRAAAAALLLPPLALRLPKPAVAVMTLASDADGTMNRRNLTVWPRMMVQ